MFIILIPFNLIQIELFDFFFRQFEQNKIISIKFDANTTNISGVNGLRIIPFSIHPTISDIIYIANLTAPLHIYPIGESKKISFDWRSLCREL